MFLALLSFFGPTVLGVAVKRALLSGRKNTGLLMLAVIGISFGYLVLAFPVPFQKGWRCS